MNDDLTTVLKDRFGLEEFRLGQRQVVEAILSGRNAVAIFPTGGGKSLCYQLPALLLPGLTIVVSPLMALMKDQVDKLQQRGINAVRLDSSLDQDDVNDSIKQIDLGKAKLLYVSPERFFNETFRRQVSRWPISLFAIDEAHCISEWGHAFRPDYLKLASIATELKARSILALTATATIEVETDIRTQFRVEAADSVRTPFFRSNLQLHFMRSDSERERDRQLLESLVRDSYGARIIYVTFQKTAETLAESLAAQGFQVVAYHAGLDNDQRVEIQQRFMEGLIAIVVATIAFGMGIDKSNIRYVTHYNPSKSLESYAQEIGRAGRDGELATCETFLYEPDRISLENFAYGDTPSKEDLVGIVDLLAHQPDLFYISYYSIAYQFDVREIVIRTVLTYLELEGYLESTTSRYDSFEFKSLVSQETILEGTPPEDRRFVIELLSMAVKKKIWSGIKVTPAMMRLRCDRSSIVDMIDRFSRNGWWEVKSSGLLHGFRHLLPIVEPKAIAKDLYKRFQKRELQETRRVQRIFDLATSKTCQYRVLSKYFGDKKIFRCGQCSACLKRYVSENEALPPVDLGDSAVRYLDLAVSKKPDRFRSSRQQTRFLCGISSPGFIIGRISKMDGYGCCSELPFPFVLAAIKSRNRK